MRYAHAIEDWRSSLTHAMRRTKTKTVRNGVIFLLLLLWVFRAVSLPPLGDRDVVKHPLLFFFLPFVLLCFVGSWQLTRNARETLQDTGMA